MFQEAALNVLQKQFGYTNVSDLIMKKQRFGINILVIFLKNLLRKFLIIIPAYLKLLIIFGERFLKSQEILQPLMGRFFH